MEVSWIWCGQERSLLIRSPRAPTSWEHPVFVVARTGVRSRRINTLEKVETSTYLCASNLCVLGPQGSQPQSQTQRYTDDRSLCENMLKSGCFLVIVLNNLAEELTMVS